MPVRTAIIPNLRYRDPLEAIDFLCNAFGFETKMVVADEEDPSLIHHAQLTLGDSMIMLSSVGTGEFADKVMKTVREVGGNTMALYVTVDDVDEHARRAKSAGAEIFLEPEDMDYGGRGYSAMDLEGYAWSFGSYDPFAEE